MADFDERLLEHTRVWDAKPALRAVYGDFHRRLNDACPPGPLLDIGGGSAHFKAYREGVTTLDILPYPGIDVSPTRMTCPSRPAASRASR